MKRSSLLILLVVAAATAVVQPAPAQVGFALGLKSGINIGTLSIDPDPYQGATTITKSGVLTFLAAVQAELIFAKIFGVQIEPGYASKSTKWEDQQGGKRTISISQIQIPILFKILFLQGTVQPYAFLGPNLGIVASASDKIETPQGTQDTDIKKDVSSLDFALDFGGGAKFNIARNVALTGDVRYSFGLSNLDNRQVPVGVTAPSAKSRGLHVLIGALFAL